MTAIVFSVFFFFPVRSSRPPGAVVAAFPSFIFGVSFDTSFIFKYSFQSTILRTETDDSLRLDLAGCWRPVTLAVRRGSRWPAAPGPTLLGVGWAPVLVWDTKEVMFLELLCLLTKWLKVIVVIAFLRFWSFSTCFSLLFSFFFYPCDATYANICAGLRGQERNISVWLQISNKHVINSY